MKTGKQQATIAVGADPYRSLVFSPDGKSVVSVGGERERVILMWDVVTANTIATFRGHTASVVCLAISPDGRLLASGSKDESIKLWEVASGKVLATLPAVQAQCLAFSPDSKTLASGAGTTL